MQVSQEDYEDKLHQINRLNREVQAMKQKVDVLKHQRDTIMDCLVEVADIAQETIEYESYNTRIREAIVRARTSMGQSETM